MPLRRRGTHFQQLTEFEQNREIGLQEVAFSFHNIAKKLGRNVSTVYDCWEQLPRHGTASRKQSSGRSRSTTEIEVRRIRRTAVAHRTASEKKICCNWYHSDTTKC
ncbi:transposable element Tc1 transposase [Trichonephila clavipes]|uniref:Transposable element Tc1 transposase n=1 Tax=Trichonephila clavipes TaxID=2585209 RepID=A0A8X6R1G6_TRICX|nr:transposable element Tc1 transposase [Trichonephila clavipes]